jgi:flagellar assembly protein FliH
MSIADFFENFDANSNANTNVPTMSDDDLEDIRLAAFEKGYAAGWEDALKSQATENSRASNGMAHHLEDISFTFHEAREQFAKCSGEILRLISEKFLPEILHGTLGQHILQEIESILNSSAPDALTIFVPKGKKENFQNLLKLELPMSLYIEEDISLNDDQIALRVIDIEREINVNRTINSMLDAIDTFTFENEMSDKYG